MLLTPESRRAPDAPRVRRHLRRIEQRLVRCFDTEPPRLDTITHLRGAALDYGRTTRLLGLRPEQLVIALKRLLLGQGGPEVAPRRLAEGLSPEAPVATTR